ncbi:MAG: FkbM family methyltransferase [Fuerstiella sp.]
MASSRKFVQAARSADVIADIGTNLGWFTCLAANANPKAQVFGFELDRANYELCKRNVSINQLTNVVLRHAAVSNAPGKMAYGKTDDSNASAMHRLGNQTGNLFEVQAITLDEYFRGREYPSLLKIDVEGAEQLVLEGMPKILQADTVRTIFIEIHPLWLRNLGGSVPAVMNILSAAGFDVFSLGHRVTNASEKPVVLSELKAIDTGGEMLVARRRT